MSRKFKVPLGLLSLANDPSPGEIGDIYFNTTSQRIKVYNGTAWVIPENNLENTLADYILIADLGEPQGPAELGLNGQLLLESSIDYTGSTTQITTTSLTSVYQWDISLYTTVEYILQIKQGSKYRSSKIMVLTDKTSIAHTQYGIIQIGSDITGLQVDVSKTGSNAVLSVQISDANTTSAQVKVIRNAIA